MGDVVFLSRNPRYGSRSVIGPVTGIGYTISQHATPVSKYDAAGLLSMTEPPCCGGGPFVGEVRSFGVAVPTKEQLSAVPDYLWDASPPKVKSKSKRVEKLFEEKIYEKPEDVPGVVEEWAPATVETENIVEDENQEVD